jgi:SNF2 family DNA or RNA helicase
MNMEDLHEYQKYSVDFIVKNPACGLLLEMGLGKSVITLTAIVELLHNTFEVGRVLVVAPLRVAKDTWSKECEKWEHLKHLKISKILGSKDERIKAINRKADIYIINRENIAWLVDHYKTSFPYDMVVLDELSSFKNHNSERFKAIKTVRPYIKRIVGLTGTPAPNGLEDLWSQIYLLDKGERLGRFIGQYRRDYFTPDQRKGEVIYSYKPRKGAEQAIYDKLSDICVSMKAVDYITMPERIDNFVEVILDDKEQKLYSKLERDALLPFASGDIDAVNAAALTNKLLQMANGAVYDENGLVKHIHDRKLDALEDLIESANGKPVLIFYNFRHDRDRIAKRFNAVDLRSSESCDTWNNGEILIAMAQPASVGHGLNLQAGGSNIIWFGLNWSLELYSQANARLWRQGQKNTVVVNHIITKGTTDESVMAAIRKKEKGQAGLIQALKARIGG